MIRAELRRGDGLGSGRIWLRTVVRNAQRGLAQAGHVLDADGKFGRGTQRIVRDFQESAGVAPSGVVELGTWNALAPHLEAAVGAEEAAVAGTLRGFRGDLDWVHEREGHRGRPYWPGGASGVTLDPGVDLGHASPEVIQTLYAPLLTRAQMQAVDRVLGLRGEHARDALSRAPGLDGIRISREQALTVMPHAARPYWDGIVRRFPALGRARTPPSVQTALLSLAYNRGVFNPALEPLGDELAAARWGAAADRIGRMQQSHRLQGIRERRRQEAALVRAELELLG